MMRQWRQLRLRESSGRDDVAPGQAVNFYEFMRFQSGGGAFTVAPSRACP